MKHNLSYIIKTAIDFCCHCESSCNNCKEEHGELEVQSKTLAPKYLTIKEKFQKPWKKRKKKKKKNKWHHFVIDTVSTVYPN